MKAVGSLEFEQAALESASRRLGLRRVVLYGSHATGEPAPGPKSDVDIAVALAGPHDRSAFWQVHDALGDVFAGRPLDLGFLEDADPLFRWDTTTSITGSFMGRFGRRSRTSPLTLIPSTAFSADTQRIARSRSKP